MAPFEVDDEPGRVTWRELLLTIEQAVVLAEKYPGMIADDLSDNLWARSTGHFASLMSVIKRGCTEAIESGEERLTDEILAVVKNDVAAERNRKEMLAAIESGRLSSRPRLRRPRQGAAPRRAPSLAT